MTMNPEDEKSCDPQLFGDDPTEEWGIERLGQYAQARHQEIEAEEQSLACTYWRLGLALNLARREFSHGQWTKFLDALGIDKTRASRARAIQRSFDTECSLEGMSVQEAYRCRKRKVRKPSANKERRKKSKQKTTMVDWLFDVCNKADLYCAEADFADSEEASSLLSVIENAVAELTRLQRRLQQRIDAQ